MDLLKKYGEKFGVKSIVDGCGAYIQTNEQRIIFSNGWIACISKNIGNLSNKKYSVAMCDYDGCFNWSILNQHGGIDGCIYCDDELEIIIACETIRMLNEREEE